MLFPQQVIKRRARVLALALIAAVPLGVAPRPAARAAVAPPYRAQLDPALPLTAEQWQQDLQFLASQLPLLHKNAFTKITPEQFNQAVADLSRDIPVLEAHEIVVRMMRIVAMIGDAHTDLTAAGSGQRFGSYPLRLYWFREGLYVTAAQAPYGRAVGARLVRIGATDVGQAYQAVGELIPHETEQWLMARSPALLVTPEVLHALRILPSLYAGHFVFKNAAGEEFAIDMSPALAKGNVNGNTLPVERGASPKLNPALPKSGLGWVTAPDPAQGPLPSYLKHPDLNYWFEYLADAKTIYVQYNVCQNMPGLPFSQFQQNVANFASTHQVERAVIDLRNNSGGDSSVFDPMFRWVQTDPYFSQRGHTFVVTGRRTFSSGMINAAQLKYLTNAILVGEPTGGKPNSFGEVRSFRLPNSGLTIFYSTRFFDLLPDDPPYISPEIFVDVTAADYFAGHDAVFDVAR